MASAAASLDPSTMVQITAINHLEELASVSTKILISISTLASLLKADGWTDGSMDGWTDGRMDRLMHGWMDGWYFAKEMVLFVIMTFLRC